jgi:hypothetical protein
MGRSEDVLDLHLLESVVLRLEDQVQLLQEQLEKDQILKSKKDQETEGLLAQIHELKFKMESNSEIREDELKSQLSLIDEQISSLSEILSSISPQELCRMQRELKDLKKQICDGRTSVLEMNAMVTVVIKEFQDLVAIVTNTVPQQLHDVVKDNLHHSNLRVQELEHENSDLVALVKSALHTCTHDIETIAQGVVKAQRIMNQMVPADQHAKLQDELTKAKSEAQRIGATLLDMVPTSVLIKATDDARLLTLELEQMKRSILNTVPKSQLAAAESGLHRLSAAVISLRASRLKDSDLDSDYMGDSDSRGPHHAPGPAGSPEQENPRPRAARGCLSAPSRGPEPAHDSEISEVGAESGSIDAGGCAGRSEEEIAQLCDFVESLKVHLRTVSLPILAAGGGRAAK